MQSLRFHGIGDVRLDDVEATPPGPGEILVSPEAVGICGTDIHIIDGEFASRPPMALGHEISARVVELGKGVTSVRPGDFITVEPHIYCGVCYQCQSGIPNMCPQRQAPGVHLDGGLQHLLTIPAFMAYHLPPEVPAWMGALTEPIACCVHGMDRLEPRSGNAVVIFGIGPIGAILISLSKLAGLSPIIAVDPRESRRDLAERFGAEFTIDPQSTDVKEEVLNITKGVGSPFVIDAVGAPGVLEQCIDVTSRGGRVLVLGVAHPDRRASISPNDIYAREITILGTALNPFTHARAAQLLPRLGLEKLSRKEFVLADYQDAFDAQRFGHCDKAFILPNATPEELS